jgi:hypothetical protein
LNLRRIAAEYFNGPDDVAVGVLQWSNADQDRDPMAGLVVKVDFRFAGMATIHTVGKRTFGLTQLPARVIDVHEDIVEASPPQDLLTAISGQSLGAFVPERDASFPVGEIDPIAEIVQQLAVEPVIIDHAGSTPGRLQGLIDRIPR